jgi:predicted metal-dependent peptidase
MFEISSALENHHAIFYKLWQMGRPIFSKEIDTAAVKFDKEGNYFLFLFNPDFWDSLDFYNKLFVISHECLHVILNHGSRIKDSKNLIASNQSLDIVVNHLLINKFGFKRDKIKDWETYCWIETLFPNQNVSQNENYEYYYNLFTKKYGDGYPINIKTIDNHNFDIVDNKEFLRNLSDEEKKSLSKILEKHIGVGDWALLEALKKKKRKWESVIKKWSLFKIKQTQKEVEQWARLNRRLSMLSKEIFLPSEMETEEAQKQKDKIEVCFFLDTSGSCWDLKDRFFTAANSLPKQKFNVKLYCFDTEIWETTLESKRVYGGGGTSFAILESFIQKLDKHPDGIFVITDGYGDFIKPKKPKNWHWFLTEHGIKNLISKECNFYELSDFE